MIRRGPRLSFTKAAVLYSLFYAAAVVADHWSTVAAINSGAVETNVFFQAADETLAQGRAALVFLLLWPVMLALLWLADRRSRGIGREPGWLARQVLGRTPDMAAFFPVFFVIAKLFAALTNMLIVWTGYSINTPLRRLLSAIGIGDWNVQSAICTIILILLPALALAMPVARWCYSAPANPALAREGTETPA